MAEEALVAEVKEGFVFQDLVSILVVSTFYFIASFISTYLGILEPVSSRAMLWYRICLSFTLSVRFLVVLRTNWIKHDSSLSRLVGLRRFTLFVNTIVISFFAGALYFVLVILKVMFCHYKGKRFEGLGVGVTGDITLLICIGLGLLLCKYIPALLPIRSE